MQVLVLGGGGREHALCWKIAQSALLNRLWCAPGNAGIADVAECVTLDICDANAVIAFCHVNAIDLLVIGPEAPLEAGVSDAARAAGLQVFGPSQAAAMLETSKRFTKEICDASGAATAAHASFTDPNAAKDYIRAQGAPIVVKADGLAAGKGVVVAASVEDALEAVDTLAGGPGGEALLIEECLFGEEVSLFILTDGTNAVPLAAAQDHKRAFDGDEGPNTGGMGAYSPAPVFTEALRDRAMTTIIAPVLTEMARRGTPYAGVLYAGLILTADGPKLIEFNARFGDPECQCILPRLRSDLLPVMIACAQGNISNVALDWSDEAAMTVVMATKGYPGNYAKGSTISGVDEARTVTGVTVFHAGTGRKDGAVIATGGRVLNVTATGGTLQDAKDRAYDAVSRIDWAEGFCRTDIGWRALR